MKFIAILKATKSSEAGIAPAPEAIVTDGPFAETNELIGAYWIVKVLKAVARGTRPGRRTFPLSEVLV